MFGIVAPQHKVEINKKEGNELVKDGNFGEGIKRYNNALMHCSKFYDLSPEQMVCAVRSVSI